MTSTVDTVQPTVGPAGRADPARIEFKRNGARITINAAARMGLPAPGGVVPLRIGGGAHKLEIVRPGDAAVRLRVGGGAHRLAFDDQRYGAIGGLVALDTPDAADTSDRYEIEIAGGVSHLTVGPQARDSLVS